MTCYTIAIPKTNSFSLFTKENLLKATVDFAAAFLLLSKKARIPAYLSFNQSVFFCTSVFVSFDVPLKLFSQLVSSLVRHLRLQQ